MDELVSIIIPCYQQGHYLPQALESALAQTHRKLEIIIVNDGSTDTTGAVAARYQARHPDRIRLIEQKNRGQARARQAGLEIVRGDFLVMLDADDLLEPEMIERCLGRLQAEPRATTVVGDAWLIDAQGRRRRAWPQRQITPWPHILRNNPYGALAAIMTRTQAVREVGGVAVEGPPGVEDWDLWARMARCQMRFVILGRPVGGYRQLAASTSHKAAQMLKATVAMFDRCRKEDPRLKGCGAAMLPPLSDALYEELRNGKVMKSLGLALSCEAPLAEIRDLLAWLVPGRLSVRYCSDQFLEGIHYGFFLQMSQSLPPELPVPAILGTVEENLTACSLQGHAPALRREIMRTLANPLRKRSLLTRLQERLRAWSLPSRRR